MEWNDNFMKPFVYALNKEARDKCLQHGYTLLKSDDEKGIYVFTASDETFALEFDAECSKGIIFSDTLTFSM